MTSARGTTRQRRHDVYICAGLALLTVLIHLYVNTDVTNDHAGYLAMARQIVYGDWPIRDFRDDGSLLQILLSAAVQKIGGFHLLGEMLLSWAFFAAANCLTFWLAYRLSGSRVAAAAAAVLAALLVPRPYAYPKLFIYPLAILALWRYVERPQMGRLAAVAATTALAFLFRIDHGVAIAATSVVAVAAVHAREPRAAVRQGLILARWFLLFALPQLVYVMWSVDLSRYVESIVSFGAYAGADRAPWPVALSVNSGLFTETNAVVFLLDLFLVIAGIALVHAGVQAARAWSHRIDAPRETLWILVVVVMWGLMLPMLARGQYYTRIAEIGPPIAILGAWLAVRWLAVDLMPSVRWAVLGALLAATVVALCWRTPMVRFFTRPADVFRGAPFQSRLLKELATSPPIDRFAPRDDTERDRWMVRYAYLCTKPNDRLLVTWYGPEVYFYAGRAFAGDRWVYLPFDNSPERQHQVVEQIRAQSVPLVLVERHSHSAFTASWPVLADYLDEAYTIAAEVTLDADRVTRVLTHKTRVPSRHLSFANLPCFD